MDKQTMIIIWMVVMMAPAVIYGIWMRIKMMGDEQGAQFLVDREIAESEAERQYSHRSDDYAEQKGKAAKLEVGTKALKGDYGKEVSSSIHGAVKFFGIWLVYLIVTGLGGYLLIFWT